MKSMKLRAECIWFFFSFWPFLSPGDRPDKQWVTLSAAKSPYHHFPILSPLSLLPCYDFTPSQIQHRFPLILAEFWSNLLTGLTGLLVCLFFGVNFATKSNRRESRGKPRGFLRFPNDGEASTPPHSTPAWIEAQMRNRQSSSFLSALWLLQWLTCEECGGLVLRVINISFPRVR